MLEDTDYVRQRAEPRFADTDYMPLSDLLLALQAFKPEGPGKTLDFGAGGSPYRHMFPGDYHRADVPVQGFGGASADLRYRLDHDSRLPADVETYDLVLSTQVLEHVPEPDLYLREAARALRPGGRLIVTTHGSFEDHASPSDYWRWTGDGLARLANSAGFRVLKMFKLTCGPRATVYLTAREAWRLPGIRMCLQKNWSLLPLVIAHRVNRARVHADCDRAFAEFRCLEHGAPGPNVYVGLAMLAEKAS